jgi:CRP-like cAMP-binding protein
LIAAGNHLMARLPAADRQRLLTLCEPVSLSLMERLYETGQANRHLWFPESACISLVSQVPGHGGLEVAMVGREGLLGAELALGGEQASTLAVVQGAGSAWRIADAALLMELGRSAALRHSINGYLHVLMSQFATACACQRFHRIGPRLARWLLVRHDRAEGQPFHVTHECLASMLGVRRVGVTVAAGQLQAHGLIRYHRGEVVVLDRSRLEARACSCYAADRAAYRAQLGS